MAGHAPQADRLLSDPCTEELTIAELIFTAIAVPNKIIELCKNHKLNCRFSVMVGCGLPHNFKRC